MSISFFRALRPIQTGCVLVALTSIAFVTHALLMGKADAAKPQAERAVVEETATPARLQRVALVIGNATYPDATTPLTQAVNDARAMTEALRGDGFDVDLVENADRNALKSAVDRLAARVGPETVVMLFFGGYAVEARGESYMLPVDAAIWREKDVRRDGVSVESVLSAVGERGARAKLVVLDASRRNPYERRFRGYSHGLGPIAAPDKALILSSASAGQVADDNAAPNSVLVSEFLTNLKSGGPAETLFDRTQRAVSAASAGAQVPVVSSALSSDVTLGATAEATAFGG